jgi:hypothetical protein
MAIAITRHALEASWRVSQAWSDMYLGNWSEFNVYTKSAVHNKSAAHNKSLMYSVFCLEPTKTLLGC